MRAMGGARLVALITAGGLLSVALDAEAQPERKVAKIGVINYKAPVRSPDFSPPFWGCMRELGRVEGQSLVVELRGAGGDRNQRIGVAVHSVDFPERRAVSLRVL